MQSVRYDLPEKLRVFVNCIMTDCSDESSAELSLPLYADGFPGLMFQRSDNGFYMLPKRKRFSELFLYGQTIEPTTLSVRGRYQFIVFQLYPFASKYLLNVDPRELNDDCYDLLQLKQIDIQKYNQQLKNSNDLNMQIEVMCNLIESLLDHVSTPTDDRIQNAVHLIIKHQGQIRINKVLDHIYLTERTFERNFSHQIGLTPKQFAGIIRFQSTLNKLDSSNYKNLTDISFESGFSDQSHFVRVFKSYTGLSPSKYIKQALSS